MYIHLGNNSVINTKEIIGIFDLDNATVSKRTRNYLKKAEQKGEVISTCADLPKSFVICVSNEGKRKIYLSQLSTVTLDKRKNYFKSSTYKKEI